MSPAAGANGPSTNGISTKTTNGAATNDTSQEIPVTKLFAQFIANATPHMLNDALRTKVKEVVIDFIGVTAGAAKDAESTESIVKGVRALGGDRGSSTVFLHGKNFLPQYAALLNAAFGHSFDFDDTYAPGTLHAGVTAISAALAQAELLGDDSTSDDFMIAVSVGYEVTCRLGRELGYEAYSQGMHNTATAGIFGAVAAISVLKRLSADVIEMAFGLAGSKAAGSMQYLENGSWNKRMHPGFAAHDAFACVALAEAGVIGATKSIEGKFGFLHAYSPRQNKNMKLLTDHLGTDWAWLASSLKPYPACRMTHGFIEMAGKMGEIKREGVEHITLTLNPQNYLLVGQTIPNKLHPRNSIDAQFSAYYQTANAWLYGSHTGWKAYSRLHDEALHALCDRISVEQDSECRNFECRIHVRWRDGKEMEKVLVEPLGEVAHPFTRDKVDEKFHSLADPVFGKKEAKTIIDMVDDIERYSVVELLRLLQ
jgi:2-methylcitrate dehydratase PrpD